ncbi:CRM domain-containing protein [Heracleum sosnowskyi]|uniref:CRM domain-containing protein n=1 Tax=Heracleum sosnowskyi TaxID=360622 RepID=A0AAD8LYH2_9APIA|nr:CRM domain-containing protein [Heracleum sosnowskyi]
MNTANLIEAKKMMMARGLLLLAAAASKSACNSKQQLKNVFFNHPYSVRTHQSFCDVICKAFGQVPAVSPLFEFERFHPRGSHSIHTSRWLNKVNEPVKAAEPTGSCTGTEGSGDGKIKRKKLKGKRAVVKWLKSFRFKKKRDYERMTAEEKILFKLRKARKKEDRYVEALKKLEPKESAETKHDPEILTPEEHFFFLKMGQKSRNYVPVGRRGIYQGVILNMHLHWKKHQTLQVVVKTFSPEEVREIAVELARLTGGIVLDIQEDNTIIMYRGKNYTQPPTEIMSPRITLPRKKALDKSKYRDGLRAVRKYIPRLEQDLELLRARAENQAESNLGLSEGGQIKKSMPGVTSKTQLIDITTCNSGNLSKEQLEGSLKLQEVMAQNGEYQEDDDSITHSGTDSDSEALSDIFETESDTENEKEQQNLYLDEFDKFPARNDRQTDDFEVHLRQISADSKLEKKWEKDTEIPNLDEVDRMVLRAASLLKKKRR